MRSILGPELGARLKPIWGLDPEGEIKGAWRDIGVPRAWCMMGKKIVSSSSFLIPRGGVCVKIPNVPRQGTLRCAGSTRRISRCVSILFARYSCHVVFRGSADIASLWHRFLPFPRN